MTNANRFKPNPHFITALISADQAGLESGKIPQFMHPDHVRYVNADIHLVSLDAEDYAIGVWWETEKMWWIPGIFKSFTTKSGQEFHMKPGAHDTGELRDALVSEAIPLCEGATVYSEAYEEFFAQVGPREQVIWSAKKRAWEK